MEFPASRRDRLVMGLSIGALILFIANIATFVKQHFFDGHVQAEHAYVVSRSDADADGGVVHFEGRVAKHAWRIEHLGGNNVWSVTQDDLDCELERLEREMAQLEGSLEMDEAHHVEHGVEFLDGRKRHRFQLRARNMAERLSGRLQERQQHELTRGLTLELKQLHELRLHELDTEMDVQVEVLEQLIEDVKVEEREDETGRKSYRVVVRSGNSGNDNR